MDISMLAYIKKKFSVPYELAMLLLDIFSKDPRPICHGSLHVSAYCSMIHNSCYGSNLGVCQQRVDKINVTYNFFSYKDVSYVIGKLLQMGVAILS